jgi:hypothetical protein
MKGLTVSAFIVLSLSFLFGASSWAQEWTLLSPVADVQVEQFKIANRIPFLNGKTIGLFWNGKPNGDVFLEEIANQLQRKFGDLKMIKFWEIRPETRTAFGNSDDNLKFMSQNADLIIASSAD